MYREEEKEELSLLELVGIQTMSLALRHQPRDGSKSFESQVFGALFHRTTLQAHASPCLATLKYPRVVPIKVRRGGLEGERGFGGGWRWRSSASTLGAAMRFDWRS